MSRLTEKRMVAQEVSVSVVCDGCGKRVDCDDRRSPAGWHCFSTSSNWGNDSCESFEWFDVCSFACFVSVARRTEGKDKVDDFGKEFVKSMLSYLDKAATDTTPSFVALVMALLRERLESPESHRATVNLSGFEAQLRRLLSLDAIEVASPDPEIVIRAREKWQLHQTSAQEPSGAPEPATLEEWDSAYAAAMIFYAGDRDLASKKTVRNLGPRPVTELADPNFITAAFPAPSSDADRVTYLVRFLRGCAGAVDDGEVGLEHGKLLVNGKLMREAADALEKTTSCDHDRYPVVDQKGAGRYCGGCGSPR